MIRHILSVYPSGPSVQREVCPVNILFVLADQFRHDCLSALGHPVVQTPHLDGLGATGTLFTRTYCATRRL